MATHFPLFTLFSRQTASLEERIQGTPAARVMAEFLNTSALFPILDAIRGITAGGWLSYLTEPAHYVLFLAALIQAWFLGAVASAHWRWRFLGNLVGFSLYAPIDIILDGPGFFSEPYHWLFGGFSLLMAVLNGCQSLRKSSITWQTSFTLLLNISKLLLLPAMYVIIELGLEVPSQLSLAAWRQYMQSSGHQFILYGVLFFGILLGLAEAQRLNYAQFLRYLAKRLKQYSEWSLGSELVTGAIDNPATLQLRRVEKSLLFMDIRGFTAWTEKTEPHQAVKMLNLYYNAAETIISDHNGHKPNFTADEVMTRFATPEAAFNAALDLQEVLTPLLSPFNLGVGIGLHTGDVIEGLMGSDSTRKFDVIGDTVNTAKRLESAANQGEILISATTFAALSQKPATVVVRSLQVKGKSQALQAFVIQPQTFLFPNQKPETAEQV